MSESMSWYLTPAGWALNGRRRNKHPIAILSERFATARPLVAALQANLHLCGYIRSIEATRSFRFLSDEQLLSQCRVDHYRGSGPGGQKRNKTSNGVRFAHLPTGILATATESRSLKENHLYCLRRLRVKLAAEVREGVDPIGFEVPDWFLSIRHERKIDVSHRHEFYAATAGLILDLLTINGNPAAVAVNLGVTTTAVVKMLEAETAWWAAANDIRAKLGMAAMQSRGK
jgi:hypothetical protein